MLRATGRRIATGLAFVVGGLTPCAAIAADAPPPPVAPSPAPAASPPPPRTPEQAADAVLAAVTAHDDAALRQLASNDDPDPWLVADELTRRDRHDAAEAFAKAAPRVDTNALPAYVASRRGQPDDPTWRARLAQARAELRADRPEEARRLLGPTVPNAVDVPGVTANGGRGYAWSALARPDEAVEAFRAAAEGAERLGWISRASVAYDEWGAVEYRREAFAAARAAWERCAVLEERRGDRAKLAQALRRLGTARLKLTEFVEALAAAERARALYEALGDTAGVSATLDDIANVHFGRGELATSIEVGERAVQLKEALGDFREAARMLHNIGFTHAEMGELDKADAAYERALAAAQAGGDPVGARRALGNLGVLRFQRGDFEGALRVYERSRAADEAAGNRAGLANVLNDIGGVHASLGDYAQALSAYERCLEATEAVGDRAGAAATLGNIGIVYYALGDYDRALATLERVRAMQTELGAAAGAALTLSNIGLVQLFRGDDAQALPVLAQALAAQEALGDRVGAARTLGNIGLVHDRLGDHAKALSVSERAMTAKEAIGDRVGAAQTLSNIGGIHATLGDYPKALAAYERALVVLEALGDRGGAVKTLGGLASAHVALGAPQQASTFVRRAVDELAKVVCGLGLEDAAGARAPWSFVLDVGVRAALATKDVSELAWVLESGRAGALLDGLKSRDVLDAAAIPEPLRRAEAKARAVEASATRALQEAADAGDRAVIQTRRAELDAASETLASVIARIQREAKAGASLVHPEAATLDQIRATLGEGEALVLYALTVPDAAALVVTRSDARIVALGPTDAIEGAVEALGLDDATRDPTGPTQRLAALVVTPLTLSTATRRVLVSPSGVLSYVPFAPLLPDVTVAYVPSGTTYAVLREADAAHGDGVLALGDPDYATRVDDRAVAVHRGTAARLSRLPATRDEAKAVGTVTLLGAEATETRLRAALAERKRWKAVHLACHGLVNAERPALSSLAITAAGDDDGFLTCLDVFRMKIPADLVVLSACETGKGKVVAGEGLVGLTRAFMFAGSPRVLCSLWKVDDAATSVLMTRFYALWAPKDGTPGLPTADALRRAQEHVRAHEKWKHPYYWAAWVLWGLPS